MGTSSSLWEQDHLRPQRRRNLDWLETIIIPYLVSISKAMSHIDIVDRNNRRLLQIRNPWSKGGIPKSTFSTIELQDALSGKSALTPDESLGTFWIDYASLSQMFKTLYLNWNPALFLYSYSKHFSFIPNGSDFDVGRNGQYTISTQGPGDVWILVERHYFGKSEGWEGYIGLAVFSGNERIYSYSGATYRVFSISSELT